MLLEVHKSSGQGGQDKMICVLKNKFLIPKPMIEIFVSAIIDYVPSLREEHISAS